MKLARSIEEIPFEKNSAVTVGTFDGVHLAHQKIIGEVMKDARERNGRSVIVTFEPHPREVLGNGHGETMVLTTLKEREEYCQQLGVEWLVVLTFTPEFSRQSFRDFYKDYIVAGIGVSAVVEGYDHHWGRNREGNIQALSQLGKEFDFKVVNIEPFMFEGTPVSSSLIRTEVVNGSIERANKLLGRSYSLSGNVVAGDKRGRLLGYPTANIMLDFSNKLVPKDGIYFVGIKFQDNRYFGMASIGLRPTFHTNGVRTIEVNIFDFDRDIYGSNLHIDFLSRLRDELKFDSAETLIQQMHADEEMSRALLVAYQNN